MLRHRGGLAKLRASNWRRHGARKRRGRLGALRRPELVVARAGRGLDLRLGDGCRAVAHALIAAEAAAASSAAPQRCGVSRSVGAARAAGPPDASQSAGYVRRCDRVSIARALLASQLLSGRGTSAAPPSSATL